MHNHKILVCGGRDFGDIPLKVDRNGPDKTHPNYLWKMREASFVKSCISAYVLCHSRCYDPDDNWLPSDITIISGAARGVDRLASEWAVIHWCGLEEFPADWEKYGKAAGIIRNQQMLDEGKPNIVLAFPGGNGTANMIAKAEKAAIKVIKFDPQMRCSSA